MSAKLFKDDVKFLQRFLKVAGLYKGPLDGKFNAALDTAENAFAQQFDKIAEKHGTFDARTESNIRSLLPAAQIKARVFMKEAAKLTEVTCKILSGTRTYEEQDDLFAIGRTKERGRSPVTKARGGQSNHNFGIAWDVGLFQNGKYLTGDKPKEDKLYVALGERILGAVPGLEWGGKWTGFVDKPHYQLPTGKSVKQVRLAFESGSSFLA